VQRDGLIGKLAYEVALPVPLQPRRVELVEQAVERRQGQRADEVERGRAELADGPKRFLGSF
jgi:hypothetical protein